MAQEVKEIPLFQANRQIYDAVYEKDVSLGRRLLGKNRIQTLVGLGPKASYSHELADKLSQFGNRIMLVEGFGEILDAVLKEPHCAGVLPVGSNGDYVMHDSDRGITNERAIRDSGAMALSRVAMPVEYCLLANEPIALEQVSAGTKVYSHKQALCRCHELVSEHGLMEEPSASTSAAAKALAEGEVEPGSLVIASRFAAETYDLNIIQPDAGTPNKVDITYMALVVPDRLR